LSPEITENTYVTFLRWCLPRLELRGPGYRKVRRLVAKRLNRRLIELGLVDLSAYRTFLMSVPEEWIRLDAICRIPISRFYRDQATFGVIARQLLPEAAATAGVRGDAAVKCWSAGCTSGEEPYTLVLAWRLCVARDWPALGFTVIATDADETMIERAEAACYARSSLKDLPQEWLDRAFIRCGQLFCLAPEFRKGVELVLEDIRRSMPDGPFDLILCTAISSSPISTKRCSAVSRRSRGNGSGPADFSSWESTKPCRPVSAVLGSLLQTCQSIGERCDVIFIEIQSTRSSRGYRAASSFS
jgi:chemotaxis protein methyltransferase CheR